MTHRVETVMAAVVTTVTGLTTTADNINRGNPYVIEASKLPCLHVEMGPENKFQEHVNGEVDWDLEVKITATVRQNENYEQLINTIREEVHIALRTDPTLGEAFIIDTDEAEPDRYEVNAAEKPTASQGLNWMVRYRRNINNPGT